MVTPYIGTIELYKQLEILLKSDMPVFIHGSPGIGKSYIVNDIAKKNNLELRDVRLSQLDAVDLRGIPTIFNNETVWMSPVFLPKDKNSSGILFLDELNSASLSVQAAIYQLVLDRRIGEYELPKNWKIVCAGNKINDKGIVFKLPSPLVNRMVHLLLEAKYDDFKNWAILNDIHSYVLGFLGFRPDLLSNEVPNSSETNPAFCTPRAWSMLSRVLKNQKDVNMISPIIYGTVGYGAAIEFISFIKIYKTLPNIDDILKGSCDVVQKEPSALYALCSALLGKYQNCNQAVNIFAYSKKLPIEFAVMLIKDLIVKDEEISTLSEFDEWIEKYEDYLI